ncbi:hypothetical protein GCM10011591_02480 [Nocardia camponoti]|uniref:Uncharacterized protein n=1 Tax=Nocardia camponoti TaxID=1616106 RepID=A0A917V3F5_9NOCA|nr:hypothetical protein GCM10011591_02480 [Nocardia camponoti]
MAAILAKHQNVIPDTRSEYESVVKGLYRAEAMILRDHQKTMVATTLQRTVVDVADRVSNAVGDYVDIAIMLGPVRATQLYRQWTRTVPPCAFYMSTAAVEWRSEADVRSWAKRVRNVLCAELIASNQARRRSAPLVVPPKSAALLDQLEKPIRRGFLHSPVNVAIDELVTRAYDVALERISAGGLLAANPLLQPGGSQGKFESSKSPVPTTAADLAHLNDADLLTFAGLEPNLQSLRGIT